MTIFFFSSFYFLILISYFLILLSFLILFLTLFCILFFLLFLHLFFIIYRLKVAQITSDTTAKLFLNACNTSENTDEDFEGSESDKRKIQADVLKNFELMVKKMSFYFYFLFFILIFYLFIYLLFNTFFCY